MNYWRQCKWPMIFILNVTIILDFKLCYLADSLKLWIVDL